MKVKISALVVGLAMIATNASAATINIGYTGVVSSNSIFIGIPVALIGDPFSLSYTFNTDLAAPGNYINTGTSSSLSGTVPSVGSALFSTFRLGGVIPVGSNCNVGGICNVSESDVAAVGSTYSQFISERFTFQASQVESHLFPNSAIPGDITAAFVLEAVTVARGQTDGPIAWGAVHAEFARESAGSSTPYHQIIARRVNNLESVGLRKGSSQFFCVHVGWQPNAAGNSPRRAFKFSARSLVIRPRR